MVNKVKQFCLMTCLVMLFNIHSVLAADFTATVDNSVVNLGQGFQLNLSLKDAKSKGRPDFSVLEKDFTIYNSSESSQMMIVNGDITSQKSWTLVLMPKQQGKLTLPSLNIETDHGVLRSKPIVIQAKASSSVQNSPDATQQKAVYTETKLNKETVYKNEPVLMTSRLIAYQNISDISLEDPVIDGAIVERLAEPTVQEMMLQGRAAKVLQVQYLLTPIKAGKLAIHGPVFNGKVQLNSPQPESMDPFEMMRNFDHFGFSGFADFRPFSLTDSTKTINIKPAVNQLQPWLPAENLTLSEDWQGLQSAKVAEPITWKLTISAKGLASAALPSLKEQIEKSANVKVYADKPVLNDALDSDAQTISSTRQESYTLIPQSSGELALPEIKIAWWNVKKDKIMYATIPARTIHVAAGAVNQNNAASSLSTEQAKTQTASNNTDLTKSAGSATLPSWVIPVVVTLAGILILMFISLILLWKKSKNLNNTPTKTTDKQREDGIEKHSTLTIETAATLDDLQKVIQQFAQDKLAMPATSSLKSIHNVMQQRYDMINCQVLAEIEAGLYQKETKQIVIADFKVEVANMFNAVNKQLKKTKKQTKMTESFQPLNPN